VQMVRQLWVCGRGITTNGTKSHDKRFMIRRRSVWECQFAIGSDRGRRDDRAAVPGCAHYAASKAGLSGLIRSAALEFARYDITVNGVEPGLVLTEGTAQAISDERRDKMAQSVPLKRWGTVEEVAQAMLFLASGDASYITGQSLLIDGGASLPIFRS
jgi:NAD(P)-dependent dehydrogenase (short-subunit alcohol dehydrogenase family)